MDITIRQKTVRKRIKQIINKYREALHYDLAYDFLPSDTSMLGEMIPHPDYIHINLCFDSLYNQETHISREEYFEIIFTLFHEIQHAIQHVQISHKSDEYSQLISLDELCCSEADKWYEGFYLDNPRELNSDLFALEQTYNYFQFTPHKIEQWTVDYINSKYCCNKKTIEECYFFLTDKFKQSKDKRRPINGCDVNNDKLFSYLQEHEFDIFWEIMQESNPTEIYYKIAAVILDKYPDLLYFYPNLQDLDLKLESHFICKQNVKE